VGATGFISRGRLCGRHWLPQSRPSAWAPLASSIEAVCVGALGSLDDFHKDLIQRRHGQPGVLQRQVAQHEWHENSAAAWLH